MFDMKTVDASLCLCHLLEWVGACNCSID